MNATSVIVGAAAGSALMFMLDPRDGRRRRALVRDQAVRASRKIRDGVDATARDLVNRARGVTAATHSRWSDEPVPDDLLVARVRARLGRVCSHPRAIDVGAHDGRITLRGPTLVNEVNGLLAAAASVRGVNAVQNDLEIHEHPHGIPALQGEGQRVMPSLDRLRRNWAPATAGVVSAGLLATGLWIALSRWRGSGTPEHAGAVI